MLREMRRESARQLQRIAGHSAGGDGQWGRVETDRHDVFPTSVV